MHRNEQVCLLLVRDGGACLERNKGVVAASENYLSAEPFLEQSAETLAHIEHQVFFKQTVWANGSRVMTAVPGVNYDFADPQTRGALSPARPAVSMTIRALPGLYCAMRIFFTRPSSRSTLEPFRPEGSFAFLRSKKILSG